MYHPHPSAAHSRHRVPSSDDSNQLPSIGSMSLPAPLRSQPFPDYRAGPSSFPSAPSPSPPSHHLFPSDHHLQQDLEPHPSSWSRLQYALGPSVGPQQDRVHIHRFTSQHPYHHADETRAAMPSLMPDRTQYAAAEQFDPMLMITQDTNYMPSQHPATEPPPAPSYPSHPSHHSIHTPTQTQLQAASVDEAPHTARPKKSRRAKPRIDLAPDQPLTTQGRPRARVYVACVQCRTRKIRCDGAKPACHNCVHRTKADDECSYDAAPKRRGPDKVPGARQRVAREARGEGSALDAGTNVAGVRRRRRRGDEDTTHGSSRAISEDASGVDEGFSSSTTPLALPSLRSPSFVLDSQLSATPPYADEASSSSMPISVSNMHHGLTSTPSTLNPGFGSPGIKLIILMGYLLTLSCPPRLKGLNDAHVYGGIDVAVGVRPPLSPLLQLPALPGSAGGNNRFVHGFVQPLHQVEERSEHSEEVATLTAEPSLEFTRKTWWDSLLAVYGGFNSHTHVQTSTQRHQAGLHITSDLRFLLRTSSYWFSFINVPLFLSAVMNAEKRERMQPSLVYATLAIATLLQSSDVEMGRAGREKALKLRDAAQGALEASLCVRWVDEELAQAAWLLAFFEICPHPHHSSDRSASSMFMLDTIIQTLSLTHLDMEHPAVTRFGPKTVPVVPAALCGSSPSSTQSWASDTGMSEFTTFASQYYAPDTARAYPVCGCEIRKETCRRLCWNSMMLAAGFTSYMDAAKRHMPELFIGKPANMMLLFPGEALVPPTTHSSYSPKDTIWALNYRTVLLWHGCLQMRNNADSNEAERARYGINAWLEADALERALNSHTCGLERTYLYQGREYLFNVRFTISNEFQKYIPIAT
ncbi:hypothetical protein ID866_8364, partial [Astraeus odoratus]